MIKLVIIGNTNNLDIAASLIKCKNISIIGVVIDYSSPDIALKQKSFLCDNNIKELKFEDIIKLEVDICLILSFSKIIPTHYFQNTLCLNIHSGILPKWRGFNANVWAIINNEDEVGYTLHEATEEFDGGDIYYRFIEKVAPNEKYGDIIKKLRKQACDKLPDILQDIINGKILPESQKNKKYLCCMKLRKNDGLIKNWNITTKYLYNLYRVMGSPYGTGIFFEFKNNIYEITDMNLVPECDDYYGIAGAVVNIIDNKMWVKTADNIIEINSITKNGTPVSIADEFKIGNRLIQAEMPVFSTSERWGGGNFTLTPLAKAA